MARQPLHSFHQMPFPSQLTEGMKLARPIFKPPNFLEREYTAVIKAALSPGAQCGNSEGRLSRGKQVLLPPLWAFLILRVWDSPWSTLALSFLCSVPQWVWEIGGLNGHLSSAGQLMDTDLLHTAGCVKIKAEMRPIRPLHSSTPARPWLIPTGKLQARQTGVCLHASFPTKGLGWYGGCQLLSGGCYSCHPDSTRKPSSSAAHSLCWIPKCSGLCDWKPHNYLPYPGSLSLFSANYTVSAHKASLIPETLPALQMPVSLPTFPSACAQAQVPSFPNSPLWGFPQPIATHTRGQLVLLIWALALLNQVPQLEQTSPTPQSSPDPRNFLVW